MKKLLLIVAACAAMFTTSCGSSKPAASSAELSEGADVILMAEAEPDRRAYGVGTHFEEASARRVAETNARAAFAAAIQTMVTQGLSTYANSTTVAGAVNGIATLVSQDQASTMEEMVSSISKECVTNTVTIKMQRYRTPANQFMVYVCIEHRDSVEELVKQVAEQIVENVPEEVKESLKDDRTNFESQLATAFADYTPVSK